MSAQVKVKVFVHVLFIFLRFTVEACSTSFVDCVAVVVCSNKNGNIKKVQISTLAC